MWRCTDITDAGLAHLCGIHTLVLRGGTAITDAGLVHLRGIHALHTIHCLGITDAGVALCLRGSLAARAAPTSPPPARAGSP
jgi:hypothetical protein